MRATLKTERITDRTPLSYFLATLRVFVQGEPVTILAEGWTAEEAAQAAMDTYRERIK